MDRSVANLNTEQLYRKRAFDRENQRASRARKKDRVQELEEEVAQLKQRLERSEDQVRQLQRSEASLRSIIDTARASLHIDEPPASLPDSEPAQVARGVTLRDANTGLSLELPLTADNPMLETWTDNFSFGPIASDSISLALLDPGLSQQIDEMHPAWPWTADPQLEDSTSQSVPPWERHPLHVDATCRLDTVLLGIIASSRERQPPEVSSASFPSVASLLNPTVRDTQQPISNAVGQHGKLAMSIAGIPEKFACLYYMCLLLRWLIDPTKRNFEAMPAFLRPVKAQLTVPHPIWVDTVVWPEARERILESMDWSDFEVFRQLTSKTLSIHWEHDISSILITVSPSELQFNPVFETHIRQLRHWTVGAELVNKFGFLQGAIPTHTENAARGEAAHGVSQAYMYNSWLP